MVGDAWRTDADEQEGMQMNGTSKKRVKRKEVLMTIQNSMHRYTPTHNNTKKNKKVTIIIIASIAWLCSIHHQIHPAYSTIIEWLWGVKKRNSKL